MTPSYPLIWIRWIDARELDGWENTEKAIENCKGECLSIESTGRLIYENNDRLVLVSDISEDGEHVNKQMIIPQSAVIERKEVGLRRPMKRPEKKLAQKPT